MSEVKVSCATSTFWLSESWCLENPHTCTHLSIQLQRIFTMLHHYCCCEGSSLIYTLWDTMVCLHLNMQVCISLYWSPLQGDAQWWTSSYTEQRIEERQCLFMTLGRREEKLKAKGKSAEQRNRGDKVKKAFGKSEQIKQASKRKVEKKLGGMNMTHEAFTLT